MRLSLCMLVRDNCAILEECLTSIRPWVDEMIVVDTGSVDGTAELAASLGARVSHFPWIDDFAAARNASLAEAQGEWIFWMDSDDVIDAANGRKLQSLAAGDHALQTLGYVMQVHCPGLGGLEAGDVTVVDHVKMFRNRPDLRFEGRIHEQILPSIRRAGGETGWTDLFVTHRHGAVTPEARAKKHVRDLRILQLDLAERPDHPFVLFNFGMTYVDMDRPGEAAEYLERSIRLAQPQESHLPKAFSLLIACRTQTGQWEQADAASREAQRRFPEDTELQFRAAVLAGHAGRTEEAMQRYRRLLDSQFPKHERRFLSCDVGIAGHKARHNLGILYSQAGRWPEAELQWRLALAEAPHFQPAQTALAQALVAQGKRITAKEIARAWREDAQFSCVALLLEAQLADAEGSIGRAIECAQEAHSRHPERLEPLEALGRLYFVGSRYADAEPVLTKLLERVPTYAAAAHNLGAVLLALGRKQEAEAALRRSLELRPGSQATLDLLAQIGC